jgi:hypothetical protein
MSVIRRLAIRSISFCLAISMASAPALAAPVAQVIRLSGEVEVSRGNATGTLQLGAALEPGDVITTTATGRVRLQLIDGSTINLGSQSALTVADVVSDGPGTERQIELELAQGALRATAAPATPKSRFEIRTPLAVTAVRGTEWGILSDAEKSDVIILSGRVGIRRNIISGESAVSLTRNLGTTVTAEGLGPIGRWSPEQLAAFEAATTVPAPEIPFDLGAAPALNLTPSVPIPVPVEPAPQDGQKRKKACIDPTSIECGASGRNGDSGGGYGGGEGGESGGYDGDHDSDGGSS